MTGLPQRRVATCPIRRQAILRGRRRRRTPPAPRWGAAAAEGVAAAALVSRRSGVKGRGRGVYWGRRGDV